jgi:hypothetical protein
MSYKKFTGAANAALMIAILLTLVLAPAAGAVGKYKVLRGFHRTEPTPKPASSSMQPEIFTARPILAALMTEARPSANSERRRRRSQPMRRLRLRRCLQANPERRRKLDGERAAHVQQ